MVAVGTASGLSVAVACGQVAHRLGGQDPEPGQIPGMIAGPVQGGLFGQHMNHRSGRGAFRSLRRAVVRPH